MKLLDVLIQYASAHPMLTVYNKRRISGCLVRVPGMADQIGSLAPGDIRKYRCQLILNVSVSRKSEDDMWYEWEQLDAYIPNYMHSFYSERFLLKKRHMNLSIASS